MDPCWLRSSQKGIFELRSQVSSWITFPKCVSDYIPKIIPDPELLNLNSVRKNSFRISFSKCVPSSVPKIRSVLRFQIAFPGKMHFQLRSQNMILFTFPKCTSTFQLRFQNAFRFAFPSVHVSAWRVRIYGQEIPCTYMFEGDLSVTSRLKRNFR